MNTLRHFARSVLWKSLSGLVLSAIACAAGQYQNFETAVYIPVGVVRRLADPAVRQREWDLISRQVKIDKVYIESERDRLIADEQTLEDLKKFFTDHGVKAAGGITFSDNSHDQFQSFCYTNPQDREFIKRMAELIARHFDEFILDDYTFVTTKFASDIAAKRAAYSATTDWTERTADRAATHNSCRCSRPAPYDTSSGRRP